MPPPTSAHLGEDLGQDLDLQADLVVPTNSSADVSEAGLFFRSQANAAGDNLFSGTNAGFWVKVQSTGQVEVERLDTGAIIAYSGAPVSFDTSAAHDLQVAVQGTQLQVAIDGNLLELSENGLVSTTVSLPATSGSDNGAAGVLFGDEPNPGQISGQRANNLVISTYTSISGLPVQDNFQDRFKPDQSQATAANVGVGPGVHLANLSIQSVSDQDWYKFQLLRPDSIDVNLGFVPADGELALQVYDAAGTLLATGSPTAGGSVAAFSSTLPAGTYYIQVSGVGGATNTYSLSIAPDAASTTTVYYVNDGSTVDDYYTTAPGNDANTGLTPATPKASVQSVLDTYTLGPTSLVVIDTGTYTTPVTITGTEQGAAYAGSPGGSNFTYSGNRFELDDSDSNEFYALNLTGSGGIGFYVQPGTVANSRRNTLLDNTFNGPDIAIEINGGDSDVIQNNVISGGSYGIYLPSLVSATISGNTISGCGTAIAASGGAGSNVVVDGNTLSATNFGINLGDWLGGTMLGTISNNQITTDNLSGGYGIYVSAATAITIFGNDVSGNYVGISSDGGAAVVYGNTIDGNVTGLQGSGTFGGASWAAGQPNDVYDNTTGIQSYPYGGTTVQFNEVHGNVVGVEATGANDTIQNNLIYRNTGQGILIDGGSNVAVTSNTIYTPSGDGVRIEDGSSNVSLLNNILWTNSGYDLYVATDSQVGFASDYNNLYTTNPGDPTTTPGTAALVWWQESSTDLYDWQVESGYNVHSIGYTALDPTLDNPQFVDLAGDDYQLTNVASTSIAAGDPTSPFDLQPAPDGGRIELGAYGDTPLAAQSAAEYLRIDYPNYYTDWEVGVGHAILWHSYNVSGNVTIQVIQVTATTPPVEIGLPVEIADVPAAQGSYGWIPQTGSIITGDPTARYEILITADNDIAISTTSREPFAIPAASSQYYINDSSTVGDEYTTAAGNNRNTGTTPGDPKANLLPLLQSYAIGPGDTVYIDTGYYVKIRNVVLSGNPAIGTGAGAVFTGPDNGQTATLDRDNPNSYSTNIELDDAASVTLAHLSLVGANLGLWVHDQSIRFTGTYLTLAGNAGTGMTVESDSAQSVFGNLTAYDNGGDGIDISTAIASLSSSSAHNNGSYGIYLSDQGPAIVQNDLAYGNGSYGIYLSGSGPALVQDDTAYGNQAGIYVYNSAAGSPAIVGDPNLSSDPSVATNGNKVYDNSSVGIYAGGNVLAAGNTIYGQASSDAAGILLEYGGVAQQNVVYGNYYGILMEGGDDQALDNRVYDNSQAGIYVVGEEGVTVLQGNTVYSNGVGVQLEGFYYGNAQLSNNLIYANVNQGILVDDVGYGGGTRSPTTRSISRWAMPSVSRTVPKTSR